MWEFYKMVYIVYELLFKTIYTLMIYQFRKRKSM